MGSIMGEEKARESVREPTRRCSGHSWIYPSSRKWRY